jgi:hypothetical protein
MALLRKLKSLSESTQFKLFTNYDEATSTVVQNLCMIQAGMAVTPSVSLEKLYSSKQSGCIGMRVAQGWREQGLVHKCAVAACEDAGSVNESHDVLGPPQYEPQAPSFRKPLSPQSRHQTPLQAGPAWTGDHSLRTSPCLPSTVGCVDAFFSSLFFSFFFAELDPNSHGEATFGTRYLAAASRV